MITKYILFSISLLAVTINTRAQTAISAGGSPPDASAMLDVIATSQGFLAPRVALTAANAASPVTLPATGLLVFNTATANTGAAAPPNDITPGYYYNAGTTGAPSWVRLVTGGTANAWYLTGNAGTTASTSAIGVTANNNFIGTTDAKDFVLAAGGFERIRIANASGFVGIGTTAPSALMHISNGVFNNANASTAGLLISGDATSNPGYMGTRYTLNNGSANYAGFVRAVRTAGTTFIGLEIGSETNHGIRFLTNGTADANERMRIDNSGITMADATNITVNTVTGTKIGTATTQKLGFFNAAPVVQQSGDVVTALSNLGLVVSGTLGNLTNSVTFNGGGSGDASGITYNGSAARTISYNTINAPSTTGTNATGTWGIALSSFDTRAAATTPETFNSSVRYDFKQNSTNGLSDGGTYNGVMYWRKYGATTDWSGGGATEIAYTDNGNLWHRYGSSTTWGTWYKILDNNNFASTALANPSTLIGMTVTNGTAATAMRSDGAPAINPAIVPTWTGTHTFSNATYSALFSGGPVGINSATPVASLDIGGTPAKAFQTATFAISGNNGAVTDRNYFRGGVDHLVIAGRTTGNSTLYLNYTGDLAGASTANTRIQETIFISATTNAGNGKVGIGASPSGTYKLEVSGILKTSGIDENSDERLKKDIDPITDALHKVIEMRGVTYNWRKDEFPEKELEAGLQYGLIAQELEKVIPELVTTDANGWKAIEYSHLVPVLIEAIKEQQKIIDAEKQNNSALRTEVEKLATRMAALENATEIKTNKVEK